jgi:hypothetical protein
MFLLQIRRMLELQLCRCPGGGDACCLWQTNKRVLVYCCCTGVVEFEELRSLCIVSYWLSHASRLSTPAWLYTVCPDPTFIIQL